MARTVGRATLKKVKKQTFRFTAERRRYASPTHDVRKRYLRSIARHASMLSARGEAASERENKGVEFKAKGSKA